MRRTARSRPVVLDPAGPIVFPDPRAFDEEGLVAVGGDLSEARLLRAYECAIFPWYDEGVPILWWSPDPRGVIVPDGLHVSRSLRRRLRRRDFELSCDRAFPSVVQACAHRPDRGTWILPEMIDAYAELFERGHAHSFEVWMDGELVGGLYGVRRGGLFAAESMFHRSTDASKIALVAAANSLFARGITLIDVQFVTPHLASLGARAISRTQYVERVAAACARTVDLERLDPWVGVELGS
jgi:leucyl/phenylalanyl-tRNA--protein transferase